MTIFLTATQLEYQDPSLVAVPSMGATLLRLVLSLLIVIVLAFLVIKFFNGSAFYQIRRWMRILDQVVIWSNRALLLTEIAGKIYVLGVTDHNITKLLEIDDASKVAQFSAEDLEAEEYSNSFWKKTLEHFFPGRGNNSIRSKDFGEGE